MNKNRKRKNIVRIFIGIIIVSMLCPMAFQIVQSIRMNQEIEEIPMVEEDYSISQDGDGTIKITPHGIE